MGWVHDTGYEPAYAHEGYTATVLDDGTEVAHWTASLAPRVVGWRPACACGWRAPNCYPRTEWGDLDRPGRPGAELDGDDGVAYHEWGLHLVLTLPELAVHDAVVTHRATAELLEQAVARARAEGASWERIGVAAGITRQSAHDRWRHLDPAGERRNRPS